jgi:hypothetical protein
MFTEYVPGLFSSKVDVRVTNKVVGSTAGLTSGSLVTSYTLTVGRESAVATSPFQNTWCVIGDCEPIKISAIIKG